MIEVVTLPGPFAYPGKYGEAAVLNGDITNQLHHVHGLAHARAAEKPDLSTFRKGTYQVDNLDTGFEQLGGSRKFVECGGLAVNRHPLFLADRPHLVDRPSKNIHDAA